MMIFESKEALTQIFQAIEQPIKFTEIKTQVNVLEDKTGLGRAGKLDITKEDFPRLVFSFSSNLTPQHWLSMFNLFSALELLSMTYEPSNNVWKYEGQIYEPQKL